MRLVVVLIAVCLSGCGGCVDEGSEGRDQPSQGPAGRPASSVTRVLPRALRAAPGNLAITDAGESDE